MGRRHAKQCRHNGTGSPLQPPHGPVAMIQIKAVRSYEAVTRCSPSGEKATDRTGPAWCRTCTHPPP
eukprot:5231357-Alexandrium_andersonii.AAC.1